ncbi:hypothetical protein JB92DRAFT_1537554 [Gautieria morchelliformis]|nr:hypothetical protein JB92DRAFT_1537554 [Gautieria morchelliformis]
MSGSLAGIPHAHPPHRKRKMKCDAGKPACGQCLKSNRSHDCDYDDGKSKSRTQLLQEKVAVLETRLRELEGSPDVSQTSAPPLQRFLSASTENPSEFYTEGASERMYASTSSFDLTTFSTNGSPTPGSPREWGWLGGDQYDVPLGKTHRAATTEDLPWDLDPLAVTPSDLLKVSGRWWEAETLPPRIQRFLVDTFLPHRHQCGFEIDVNRFLASLTSASPPHPALLLAIYALACHFSLSPVLTPHESRFVSRALRAVSNALEASDRLVHVLQASCLLAVLFFAKGRLLEGYYHAGAATRLAVGLGLHQITPPDWLSATHTGSPAASSDSADARASGSGSGSSSILPPPVDAIELGERILAFWQVYNLDRCWAVATGLPVALSDDKYPRTRIETAWPKLLEEYEMGHVSDADYSSVRYLYSQVTTLPFSNNDSAHTLRAKATTLFERAARLSSSFNTGAQTADQFWTDFQSVDAAISRLSVCLPHVRHHGPGQTQTASRGNDTVIFVVHALLHAATIQLHAPFAFKDAASQQKSAAVAAVATAMIHNLDEADYAFLDPIMGTCWTSVAEALVRELVMLRSAAAAAEQQVTALNRQLDVVVFAMNRLGSTVPLAAYQASKVEQSRVIPY